MLHGSNEILRYIAEKAIYGFYGNCGKTLKHLKFEYNIDIQRLENISIINNCLSSISQFFDDKESHIKAKVAKEIIDNNEYTIHGFSNDELEDMLVDICVH